MTSSAPVQRTSIYVGDLPVDLAHPEDVISGLFNSVAPVVSLKVCRDLNTQRSLGYAYVNFQTAADAEKAIEALNYTEIVPGRQIRVMFSLRDPILRKSGANNVFVKKLDPSINAKTLQKAFSKFGRVLSCKVALDNNGKSKSYGFVQFETGDAAKAALSMNGEKLGEEEISVAPFVRKAERDAEAERTFTTVYANNISSTATEEEVRQEFEKFGAVTACFVSEHPPHPTKFALVTYEQHDAAVEAIAQLNQKTDSAIASDAQPLMVCRAVKKSERLRMKKKNAALYQSQGRNLYVKHLANDITTEGLEELFRPFGTITSCTLMKDSSGTFRGFGFVCFEDKESAMAAMHELNGKTVPGSTKPLYVSQAEQKDMRLRILHQRRSAMKRQPHLAPPMGMFNPQWQRSFPPMNPMYPGMGMPQFMPGPMARRPMPPMQPHQRFMMNQSRFTQPPMMPLAQPPMMPLAQPPMQPPMRQMQVDPNQLASMSPEEQKNVLGERLYNKIVEVNPAQAAKITGMLLEMGIPEILEVLDDNAALLAKVHEAVTVLRQHAPAN